MKLYPLPVTLKCFCPTCPTSQLKSKCFCYQGCFQKGVTAANCYKFHTRKGFVVWRFFDVWKTRLQASCQCLKREKSMSWFRLPNLFHPDVCCHTGLLMTGIATRNGSAVTCENTLYILSVNHPSWGSFPVHPRMKKKGSMPACLPIIKAGPSNKMSKYAKYVAMMEGNKSEPYLVPMFHPKNIWEKRFTLPKIKTCFTLKKDGFPSKDFKGAMGQVPG